jgi:DeoR family transcriptional regulator, aga operon transcriptional repressor
LRIAAAAVRLVKEGQVIILDSGTTTTCIARALRAFHNITIITNAANIAAELSGATVDLFNGVYGVDVHYGLSTPNLLELKVNRVMVEVANPTAVVCDSTKFGRRSLSLIVPTSARHEVITERDIPKADLRALKKMGMEVTLV